MDDRIEKLEKKIKELEKQVVKNKITSSIDNTKYPVYTDGKKWVSATHWYYN